MSLHGACAIGETEKVKMCIELRVVDVNKRDKDSRTPLYLASMNNHPETVKLLLDHPDIVIDEKVKAMFFNGLINAPTVIHVARDSHVEVFKVFFDHSSWFVHKLDDAHLDCLWYSANYNQVEIMKVILKDPDIMFDILYEAPFSQT